jgi:hypothetical protein
MANGWLTMVRKLAEGFAAKASCWRRSAMLTAPKERLTIRKESIAWITEVLKQEQYRGKRGESTTLFGEEGELVRRIARETEALNRNNLTRTQAYADLYFAYPELHWALLAHLVSRNGGWNMTDLKGEWLPRLLPEEDIAALFRMLESCNALIFKDAYPQLRLYAESRRTGRGLFALLPAFDVSSFMAPFWERFWIDRDPVPLTVALIVNEQNVIQQRVVRDPAYRAGILQSRLPLLQLNQVVFPLGEKADRLAGRILERFDSLDERIAFGKCLYAMLFSCPRIRDGAEAFVRAVPHTGSRADYWPHVFTAQKNGTRPEAQGRDAVLPMEPPWLSPRLDEAWEDQPLGAVSEGDWFQSLSALQAFGRLRCPLIVDITEEHMLGQRKLQAAAAAKAALLPESGP